MPDTAGRGSPGRILFMVTAHLSLGLVTGLADHLQKSGWDVHVSSAPDTGSRTRDRRGDYSLHDLPMARDIAPLDDARALLRAVRLLRRVRPDIVIAGTPKASLLGMIASTLLRTPRRVYVMHGLRLEGAQGLQRALLTALERLTCACATDVIAVSPSLASRAISLGLSTRDRIRVLGPGSANGVDAEHFRTTFERRLASEAERDGELRVTLGYVGRIHRDKGLDLLADSLRILAEQGLRGRLIVVGGDDDADSGRIRADLDASGWDVEHVGFVEDVRVHLRSMDILCFPTRREGFGSVVLEAAAAGIPTVATLATGVPDALVDGVTGILVTDRTPAAYATALSRLMLDHEARGRMVIEGRRRVERDFDQRVVWRRWENFLRSTVAAPVPR